MCESEIVGRDFCSLNTNNIHLLYGTETKEKNKNRLRRGQQQQRKRRRLQQSQP